MFVVSLFSGAGGLDIGLEKAGLETKVCIEYDGDCRATLKLNRPKWTLIESAFCIESGKSRIPGDVRDISGEEIKSTLGEFNPDECVIVGGAPCQPFSNLGKKLGANDEKNGDLFLEFARFVHELKPKAFLFENVTGISQAKHSGVLEYMKSTFDGLNYNIHDAILNSADYGTPQRRKRFFLIGIRDNLNPFSFPRKTHFQSRDSFQEYREGLIKEGKDVSLVKFKKWRSVDDAFKGLNEKHLSRRDNLTLQSSEVVKERMSLIKQGENFKSLPMALRPKCWQNGGHQGNDTFGRIVGKEPSLTIRTSAYNPTKGRYIHPYEDRGLSTLEMARLQGFPLGWKFTTTSGKPTLTSIGRQIGNAVPIQLAQALGHSILDCIAD